MKGTGTATGAITFVNALFTGVGSAAGIELPVLAEVDLEVGGGALSFSAPPDSDSPLVREATAEGIRRWAKQPVRRARVRVSSEVPVARGLKSSSAVSDAVARGVVNALGRTVTSEEVARLSAEVSRSIGLSATGAFDDALAAAEPGIHVTENSSCTRLRTDAVDPSLKVVLAVPGAPHRPSPEYRREFRNVAAEAGVAIEAARAGRPFLAMAANTELVERILGYDYAALRAAWQRAGALASGVSGLGPALAAICRADAVDPVRAAVPPSMGQVLVTRFSRPVAGGSGR